jgi:uncharacterized membrane protein
MKLLAALAGIFIALTASLPARAQPHERDQPRRFQQERQHVPQRELPRRGAGDPRQDERGAGEQARPGQLSPEERRQLRRDIREHGREVYRDRPHRF